MRRSGKPQKPLTPPPPPGPPTAPQILMTAQLNLSIRLLELPLKELAEEVRAFAAKTPALVLGPPSSAPQELPTPPDGVMPDLLMVKSGAKWKAVASMQGCPTLSVAAGASEEDSRDAHWLIKSVEQRSHALERFGDALATLFPDFIATGGTVPKPARATKFSDMMQMHESTVKRLAAGKRLQLTHGVFPLDSFVVAAPPPRP